LEESQ
jgi:dynein heavy chain